MFKNLAKKLTRKKGAGQNKKERKELEKRVVEGAQKTLKEYKKVFERLSKYDRAGSH